MKMKSRVLVLALFSASGALAQSAAMGDEGDRFLSALNTVQPEIHAALQTVVAAKQARCGQTFSTLDEYKFLMENDKTITLMTYLGTESTPLTVSKRHTLTQKVMKGMGCNNDNSEFASLSKQWGI